MAARLRQSMDERAFRTIDAHQPEVMEQLVAFQPKALILDATDNDVDHSYPLQRLLGALPGLTIIRVDPQYEQLQVITSQQRTIRNMSEMVGVISSLT